MKGDVDRPGRPILALGSPPDFAAYEYAALAVKPTVRVALPPLDSPWYDIYLTCVGRLPDAPDPTHLHQNRYRPDLAWGDFFEVDRRLQEGTLQELVELLKDHFHPTARAHTMNGLASGAEVHRSYGSPWANLPGAVTPRVIAGPNIVVACRAGSVPDLVLLWNLRAAHSTSRPLPLGVPAELGTSLDWGLVAASALQIITEAGQGEPHVFVTSASISTDELNSWNLDPTLFAICQPGDLVTFGPAPSRPRTEVLTVMDGVTKITPFSEADAELAEQIPHIAVSWRVDVKLPEHPLPQMTGHRMHVPNGRISEGGLTKAADQWKQCELVWPTRWQLTRALATRYGLAAKPSSAGLAAITLLSQLGDLDELQMLLHCPLLAKLGELAERQGMSWARRSVRERGLSPTEQPATAPTTEDLPLWGEQDIKPALSNDSGATRNWLEWAESKGLIVRGFPFACDRCGASDWMAVDAFRTPTVCRSCGAVISRPFSRSTVTFRYRLSESLRRVFEHDAIGHVLGLYYLKRIFGTGDLIGLHPGVEFRRGGATVGEVDVLVQFAAAGFAPVEVKRSFAGFSIEAEVRKLHAVSDALNAPWSGAVVCGYGQRDGEPTLVACRL